MCYSIKIDVQTPYALQLLLEIHKLIKNEEAEEKIAELVGKLHYDLGLREEVVEIDTNYLEEHRVGFIIVHEQTERVVH